MNLELRWCKYGYCKLVALDGNNTYWYDFRIFYLVAGVLLGIFACGYVFFILAILVMTCYIWIPILAIVIIIMKLCGL